MSIRCPSCGFDSPDGAAWCDFCKEPFKKKEQAAKAAPPPAPGPKPQVEAERELPKEVLARLEQELAAGDPEKVPSLPSWVKGLAWTFLGLWIIWGMIFAGILLGKRQLQHESPPPASQR